MTSSHAEEPHRGDGARGRSTLIDSDDPRNACAMVSCAPRSAPRPRVRHDRTKDGCTLYARAPTSRERVAHYGSGALLCGPHRIALATFGHSGGPAILLLHFWQLNIYRSRKAIRIVESPRRTAYGLPYIYKRARPGAAGSLLQHGIAPAERARMDATMRFSVKK